MNDDVESKLYGNGTIWFISVSSWSGKDKLKAEDIGKTSEDILDIIELGRKSLTPDETRIRMKRSPSQINSLMTTIGARKFFFTGAWWVPDNKFMQAKAGLDKIEDEQNATVDDLVDNFDGIKADMIDKYPMLADANWPTEQQLRNRFKIKCHVCKLEGAEIHESDAEELVAAKLEFRNQLSQTYQEYADQILEQAKVAMMESVQEIATKIKDGMRITEKSMKKPRRVVDDYLNIAQIFDLDEVKAEIEKLKAQLESTDADTIRGNWQFAQEFAESIKGMASAIGDISGLSSDGTVKRVVRKAA